MCRDFHDKPYDPGTLTKLQIFELYAQEWIPVFLSQAKPKFDELHIFDFFCGPGRDARRVEGSPLRILKQLRNYHEKGMAGWENVSVVVHLYDTDHGKIEKLNTTLREENWSIPGVKLDCRRLPFKDALTEHHLVLSSRGAAKLLIIDQFGVDEVTDDIFKKLVGFPTTDFIFFLSSSTLHRFRDHPAIKQKIDVPEDSYDVHRMALNYYRNLIPARLNYFLAPFSIKKGSNIYGLIFGSGHLLGIHKFLQVAWKNDKIVGEANFDIERENIKPEEGILDLGDVMRPSKVCEFERDVALAIKNGQLKTEADVARFCVESGMTCGHSAPVLKKLKLQGIIDLDFQVPDIKRLKAPRQIRLVP